MKPVAFDYVRPTSVGDAIRLLVENPDAKILAGGQTLGPMLNLRLAQPAILIDIARIPELVRVEDSGDAITLGACITHGAIEDGRIPGPTGQLLAPIARGIAYRAVRTRGTIGGSIAHADPAADWLSLLTALDASVLVRGKKAERAVRLADFVSGPMMTNLGADELIVGMRIPKIGSRIKVGYNKICRKTGEFAEAIGVAVHDRERGSLRLVAGAVGGAPIVIDDLSPPPSGQSDMRKVLRARLQSANSATGAYELNIHTAALQRAIDEACAA